VELTSALFILTLLPFLLINDPEGASDGAFVCERVVVPFEVSTEGEVPLELADALVESFEVWLFVALVVAFS
jgi:hypothetical protein